jgi:hypothetical protein
MKKSLTHSWLLLESLSPWTLLSLVAGQFGEFEMTSYSRTSLPIYTDARNY